MPGENIIDLEGLLRAYIGPNKKIIDVKKERLTAPGENYSSVMLKLDITLKNLETGKEEELNAVAKTINPEVNPFFKKSAPPQFKKEIAFYTEIVPALQEFQREQGITEVIDIFPKLYAARKNLHGKDDEVDDDCVIILENLKVQGYDNVDRIIGFDLEAAQLVLKDLATFHAVPIALRMKKPEVFEEKVKKHCFRTYFPEFPPSETPLPKPDWLLYLEQCEECQPHMQAVLKLGRGFEDNERTKNFLDKPLCEPFNSIFHGDMWCNNTMQQYKDGKLVMNKLVDFQVFMYSSIICDVIFFIWSSVRIEVSTAKFEELLDWYYQHFLRTLEQHGCDTTPFNRSKFQEAIENSAPYEFLHNIWMAAPIHAPRGKAAFDFAEEDMEKLFGGAIMSAQAKEKLKKIVIEFGKRSWIKKLERA